MIITDAQEGSVGPSKCFGHGEPKSERLDRVQNPIHNTVLAYGRRSDLSREAKVEEIVCLDERAVSVGYLVRLRAQHVQRIDPEGPLVIKPVPGATVDDARHGRSKCIVFGQGRCAEIAPTQPTKPAGVLPKGDARGGDDGRRVRNEVARRISDLGLRKAGKRRIEGSLIDVEPHKAGMRDRNIAIDRHPRERAIFVSPLNAVALTRAASRGVAAIALEYDLRGLVEKE